MDIELVELVEDWLASIFTFSFFSFSCRNCCREGRSVRPSEGKTLWELERRWMDPRSQSPYFFWFWCGSSVLFCGSPWECECHERVFLSLCLSPFVCVGLFGFVGVAALAIRFYIDSIGKIVVLLCDIFQESWRLVSVQTVPQEFLLMDGLWQDSFENFR